jgi:hypothetical protein
MTRIFSTLAVLVSLGLVVAFVTGFVSQHVDGVNHPERSVTLGQKEPGPGGPAVPHPERSVYLLHFNVGLFTAIGTLLAHCLIFTYFLGTGRWVKEVKLAYRLPDEPLPKLTRELKRRTFPPALVAMLVTIAAAASGAGLQLQSWPWQVHAVLAVAALVVNAWAFAIELRDLRINAGIITQVMEEVERIRASHGLTDNP